MLELIGDLWEWHAKGHTVAVTTSGSLGSSGRAIMGAGTAKQAAARFPELPEQLGYKLKESGNHVYFFPDFNLFTFPTKHVFYKASDLDLIARSALELSEVIDLATSILGMEQCKLPVVVAKPGCGLGGLRWSEVRPLLALNWDDRFAVIDYRVLGEPTQLEGRNGL